MLTEEFKALVANETDLTENQVEAVWEATMRGATKVLSAGDTVVHIGDLGRFEKRQVPERTRNISEFIRDDFGKVTGSRLTGEQKTLPAYDKLLIKPAQKLQDLLNQ